MIHPLYMNQNQSFHILCIKISTINKVKGKIKRERERENLNTNYILLKLLPLLLKFL